MSIQTRRSLAVALFLGGLAYALLFVPLPFLGNTMTVSVLGQCFPETYDGPRDLLRIIPMWVFFVAAIFSCQHYLLRTYVPERLERLHLIVDRHGVTHLATIGMGLSLVFGMHLALASTFYLPLGLSLVGVCFSVFLAPGKDRFPLPPSVDVPSRAAERLQLLDYAWSFRYDFSDLSSAGAQLAQQVRIQANLDDYDRIREENPSRHKNPNPGDLQELIGRGMCHEVAQLAAKIRNTTQEKGLCTFVEILNATSFVQSEQTIPYKTDEESTGIVEYWRYPLETLVDGCGDCECKTILAAVLLKTLGREVLIVDIPPKKDISGHMALAIEGADSFPEGVDFFMYQGKKYFYCEMTAEGMLPGELPAEIADRDMRILVV